MKGVARPGVIVLAICAIALSACGGTGVSPGASGGADGSGSATSGLDRVRETGLRISYVNENPWSYTDGVENFTGAEGEMIKECGERLEFDVLPILTQWDSQLPGLTADRWDAIVAGMAISDERLEVAISTQPMYGYGARAMVEKGNPLNIHSWDDIAEAGVGVGMITGGAYQEDVEALGIEVIPYDSLDAEILDLEAGRIDVLVNAETSLTQYVKDNPDAPVEVAEPWDYQDIGIVQPGWYFRPDDVELRDAINDCITELKEDGTMASLLEEFGFNPDSIAPTGPGLP